MKFILSTTLSAFGEATSEKCFSIPDEIDRKYCIDKYLQAIKVKLNTEKKTWAKGLAGDVAGLVVGKCGFHCAAWLGLRLSAQLDPFAPQKKSVESVRPFCVTIS